MRSKELSVELQNRIVEAQIWGRVPKHFCSIEGPQEHSGLHHSWEVPRADRLAKLSIWGRRALGREESKNPMVTNRAPLWRWDNLPEGQPSPLGVCQKALKGLSDKILWSDETKIGLIWSECQASHMEETWHNPYGEAWWWQHHAV